jgi:hypothetical protein
MQDRTYLELDIFLALDPHINNRDPKLLVSLDQKHFVSPPRIAIRSLPLLGA